MSAREQARHLADLRELLVELRPLPASVVAERAQRYRDAYDDAPWWVVAWSWSLSWHLDKTDRAQIAGVLDAHRGGRDG